MSEPPRLLEDSDSATEKALLHAGRSYRSGRETRAKTLAALGIASSTAIVATGGSAAASSSVAKLTGAKLLVAISAVGAVSLAPIAYHSFHNGEKSRDKISAPVASPPRLAPADGMAPAAEAPVMVAGAPATAKVGAVTAAHSAARAAVSLAQELAALDAARSTMARGDAQGALLLLDGYAKTCPQGRLRLEAELLRIDALAKTGQTQAARRRAEAFLRHHPGSVLAPRARSYTDARGGLD